MTGWKTTFAFITGVLLMHLISHVFIALEGMLPFASKVFGFTLTYDMNVFVIGVNTLLLVASGYLAFFHDWHPRLIPHPHS